MVASFQENMQNGTTSTTFNAQNLAHSPKQAEEDIFFTKVTKVTGILKTLPNKTSTGLDGIPPIVLKRLPGSIILDYTIPFNNCVNNKFFPNTWKEAKIFSILKKGKPSD